MCGVVGGARGTGYKLTFYYLYYTEDYYASEDQYPPEPEQPLYDDVENPVEPAPEAYYETAPGYGDDQEPDQPLYDDVQGPDEVQQESGGVCRLVLIRNIIMKV